MEEVAETPYRPKPHTLFAVSKKTIVITGDIIVPIDVEWETQQWLLDTHVLVWHTTGLAELGAQAKALNARR